MVSLRKDKRLTPLNRLIMAVAAVLVVVGIGSVGFVLIQKRNPVDALYMTLITISTLGMKPNFTVDISMGEQIWIMFLIMVGIAAAMIALTTIVSMVVEGHMRSILGRRKVDMKIASLHDHVIVCGCGRMGRSVCENLQRRKVGLVVIDSDSDKTTLAEQEGFLYILGDATDESVLRDAGIERAQGLVAVLDSDASNVFATLVARDLNPAITIVARAERIESEARLLRAGANKSICPQLIGATRLANILTRPGVVDFIDFATEGLDLEAEQYHIKTENKLVGMSLSQANLPRKVGLLVIALKRKGGSTIFNPGPDTVLQADDVMFVTGQTGSMDKLEKEFSYTSS